MEQKKIEKNLIILILIASLIRLFLAFNLELGNDEVYYWTYSQNLQWNYFDHPPMIAILLRLFTLNLKLQSIEGFLRLGSLFCSALSTFLIYRFTSEISTPKAGFFAALLYTATLFGSLICGLLVMPDAPQMVFWLLSLGCTVGILKNERSWYSWLSLGLFSGLCIMSKVHGIFLWFGLGMYILVYNRKILGSIQPYIAFLICLLIISPIGIWNVQNHFITYRFHSARVSLHSLDISPLNFLKEILGQMGYFNPIIFGLSIWSLFHFREIAYKASLSKALTLFNFIALPLIFLVLGISLFRVTLPHWAGPGYISLIPLISIYLSGNIERKSIPKIIPWALGILVSFLAMAYILVQFYPGTFDPGSKRSREFNDSMGMDDITLDISGWRAARNQFQSILKEDMTKTGMKPSETPLIVDTWFPGSHLYYYFALPMGMPVLGLGYETNLHQFIWSNSVEIKKKIQFHTAYALDISNYPINPVKYYSPYFDTIKRIYKISAFRGSKMEGYKPTRNFYIYRLSGFKGYIPHIEKGKLVGIPPN